MINKQLFKDVDQLHKQLITWRRKLHQIPERGIKLPQTISYIKSQLDEIGITYQSYDDVSCIVATIGEGDQCFLLRSDIDALPIQEQTTLSFKSNNDCMHACGHDLHGAILLGAAKLLKAKEHDLKGKVKLLFQGGEETTEGAIAMLERGLLTEPKVDAAFAVHVNALIPFGEVSTGKEAMAGTHGFSIRFFGKGGHGSMPDKCIDPINAAVQLYVAFQSLIAREVNASDEAVLTIGQFHAGDAPNIIPVSACLKGTLRTFHKDVKDKLVKRMQEVTQGIAQTYRCEAEYEILFDCNSLITDDVVTASIINSMKKVDGDLNIDQNAHWMGSEDFAEFSQRVPASHFMLGAAPIDETKRYALHDPRIEFNEDALLLGAMIYAQAAIDYFNENNEVDDE